MFRNDLSLQVEPYSVMKIWALWQKFPNQINVQKQTMMRPFLTAKKHLYQGFFDWSNHYNLHLNEALYRQMDLDRRYASPTSVEWLGCPNNTEIASSLLDQNPCQNPPKRKVSIDPSAVEISQSTSPVIVGQLGENSSE